MQNHSSRIGNLLLVATALVASALVQPSGAVLAATTDGSAAQQVGTGQLAATGQQAGSFKNTCANERDWVDAESGYPGSLLQMAKQSLADCEGKQQADK